MAIDKYAIEWIDANLPQAWYRPMFDRQQLAEIMKQQGE